MDVGSLLESRWGLSLVLGVNLSRKGGGVEQYKVCFQNIFKVLFINIFYIINPTYYGPFGATPEIGRGHDVTPISYACSICAILMKL